MSRANLAALKEAQIVDAIVRELSNRKPSHLWLCNNDGRNLPTVELAGRSFAGVAAGCNILQDLRLPAFDANNKLASPPPGHDWPGEVKAVVAAWLPDPYGSIEQQNAELARIEALNERLACEAAQRAEQEKDQAQAAARAAREQERINYHMRMGWPL